MVVVDDADVVVAWVVVVVPSKVVVVPPSGVDVDGELEVVDDAAPPVVVTPREVVVAQYDLWHGGFRGGGDPP